MSDSSFLRKNDESDMANKLLHMDIVRKILLLQEQGKTQRAIARELSISRTTLRRYLNKIGNSEESTTVLLEQTNQKLVSLVYTGAKNHTPDERKEDFMRRVDYFVAELKRTGVTRILLWEEYKKGTPNGYGYSKFCEFLMEESKIRNAVMHFSYTPAEVLMIDFAGDKLSYVDRDSGEVHHCQVLVCVLPYSGYSYVKALENASIPQLINALNQCLEYMGGVPHSIKSDNMKQIVSRSCRYEPTFTELMEWWAMHYHTHLVAARVRKPRDKAPVENEVKLTYQRVYAPLRDQVFFSIGELNAAIEKQLQEHHNRLFQKKNYTRRECFVSEEQPLLQSLPEEEYQLRHKTSAKVQRNYHVTLGEDWHHYSVPFTYIGKTIEIIYDTDAVEIYYDFQRIALHQRNYRKHSYTTVKEHMPEGHRIYAEQRGWDANYFIGQAKKIGECTHQYIELMLKGKLFTEQTFTACKGLLRLGKDGGEERLEAACKRALRGKRYTYSTVRDILDRNLDREEIKDQTDLFTMPLHDNIRGAEAYN